MWTLPSAAQLATIPKLYQTEELPLKDKLIHLHFFIGNTDFYICEHNGSDMFWGFVILNGDYEMAEFGYINFDELKSIRVNGWQEIDCDQHWRVRPANQVKKICIAQGWTLQDYSKGILETECPNCKKMLLSDANSDEIQCSECKIIILQRQITSTSPGERYAQN